jgi:hypothetical protein
MGDLSRFFDIPEMADLPDFALSLIAGIPKSNLFARLAD